jgi:hypothetical protein
MEKQLEEKEKQLENEMEKRLEEKQKLFKYKEEKKKRIQNKKEEWWTGSRSMTLPPCYSRLSRTRHSFRKCQPGDAQPDPVLQGVVDCLTSISNQMLRMSEGSGKNGGWPWFDRTCKGYPAFWRKWSS